MFLLPNIRGAGPILNNSPPYCTAEGTRGKPEMSSRGFWKLVFYPMKYAQEL